MNYTYRKDQELPAIGVEWLDGDGVAIDFSSGWTFSVKICSASAASTVLATKSSGISGSASLPNITIDWSTSDFTGLTADGKGSLYVAHLYAHRTADSKDDVFSPGSPIMLTLLPAPA